MLLAAVEAACAASTTALDATNAPTIISFMKSAAARTYPASILGHWSVLRLPSRYFGVENIQHVSLHQRDVEGVHAPPGGDLLLLQQCGELRVELSRQHGDDEGVRAVAIHRALAGDLPDGLHPGRRI